MIRICRIVSCPVQSTVIVPNWEDIFLPSGNGLFLLSEDLSHQSHEILGWVPIDSYNLITSLRWKLLHYSLNDTVGIFVEFLEIMAEISHYVRTVEDSLQKLVLSPHVVYVVLFRGAQVLPHSWSDELILKSMDCPSDVSWQGTIVLTVGWLRLPNKLGLILEKNMLVRTLYEKALDTEMGQNSQSGLGMSKRISRHCSPGEIVELFFQETQTSLEILNDIIIICTALIMLHKSSA